MLNGIQNTIRRTEWRLKGDSSVEASSEILKSVWNNSWVSYTIIQSNYKDILSHFIEWYILPIAKSNVRHSPTLFPLPAHWLVC